MPRRDVVERVLGVVDYVLLEGLGVRDWRELVKMDWRTMIVIIILLIYFKALHLSVGIVNLHYRLRYGIDFKGDMSKASFVIGGYGIMDGLVLIPTEATTVTIITTVIIKQAFIFRRIKNDL
jgi:hypothetical protein